MKVIFSSHALDKLQTSDARKFKITKAKIQAILKKPVFQSQLLLGVVRAVGLLDKDHSLCIIYKLDRDIIKVITFFPSEKGRYEN